MRPTIEIAAASIARGVHHGDPVRLKRSRPTRPLSRQPELQLQRGAERLAGRALRRHQATMRRQVLRECLRRQIAVGWRIEHRATRFLARVLNTARYGFPRT